MRRGQKSRLLLSEKLLQINIRLEIRVLFMQGLFQLHFRGNGYNLFYKPLMGTVSFI